MKDFFKEVEEVREVADKIDAKIQEVKKLQVAILNSPKVIIYRILHQNCWAHEAVSVLIINKQTLFSIQIFYIYLLTK